MKLVSIGYEKMIRCKCHARSQAMFMPLFHSSELEGLETWELNKWAKFCARPSQLNCTVRKMSTKITWFEVQLSTKSSPNAHINCAC